MLISTIKSIEDLESDSLSVGLSGTSDDENWWSIIETANQINRNCVLLTGMGGTQNAGKSFYIPQKQSSLSTVERLC